VTLQAANEGMPATERSEALYARALGLIPAATQTLAKGPGQFVRGVAPKYLARGKGARVFDVDGNEYLDFSMAVGPLSLGYCYPAVDDAIRAQLEDGITFSLMHPLEVEVAELVREVVPGAESVRYSKTGADVTSAAVRLARAFTGREKVLCCGYHGWHDWFIATTDRSAGIPDAIQNLSFTIPYGDAAAARDAIDAETACVILEPVTFAAPPAGYLEALRAACNRSGALLVFDEMWTGFRLALGGAQEFFGVRADLACFSKAVANGMPLSILTGRSDVMSLLDRQVFFFTTFGGEALSLAAARATIREIRARHVPAHLARLGRRLKDGYNATAAELGLGSKTACVGYDCRTLVSFDASAGPALELKSLVQQELLRRGILWQGFHNLSFSHRVEDIDATLAAYREVLQVVARAIADGNVRERLLGEPVEPVFRRTAQFNTRPIPVAARMSAFALDGRVAVVTGALGLLGRRHCEALAAAGAAIVVTDLDPAGCAARADELTAAYGQPALGHGADITAKAAVVALRDAVLARFGRVDVLVNNAAIDDKVEAPGASAPFGFEHYPLEAWERSWRVNVTGTFLCCQVFGAVMAGARRGSIVNISSTYGIVAPDQSLYRRPDGSQAFWKSAAYPVSKGGVLALTRYLAAYWGGSGVRVNALSPGGVQNGQEAYFVERYAERTPLGRMARPDDYAGAIVYLASDASAYVTGANLVVDGGFTAW
jgi:glutamate-1-semialdehyde 2,1-aminomutase